MVGSSYQSISGSPKQHQEQISKMTIRFQITLINADTGQTASFSMGEDESILDAARKVQDQSFPMEMDIDGEADSRVVQDSNNTGAASSRPIKRLKASRKRLHPRTREEIEAEAIHAGAAPSA